MIKSQVTRSGGLVAAAIKPRFKQRQNFISPRLNGRGYKRCPNTLIPLGFRAVPAGTPAVQEMNCHSEPTDESVVSAGIASATLSYTGGTPAHPPE